MASRRKFLYDAKKQFAEEVAAVKTKELFGVDSCGVSWESLFRKHLAFDIIDCGVCSQCVDNEIKNSSNC